MRALSSSLTEMVWFSSAVVNGMQYRRWAFRLPRLPHVASRTVTFFRPPRLLLGWPWSCRQSTLPSSPALFYRSQPPHSVTHASSPYHFSPLSTAMLPVQGCFALRRAAALFHFAPSPTAMLPAQGCFAKRDAAAGPLGWEGEAEDRG